jgi:transposase-like protein
MGKADGMLEEIQNLLDLNYCDTKIASILGLDHKQVNRVVKKYSLERYIPFDEEQDNKHLYQNFEWLWEEDKLEEIIYEAFDGHYLLDTSSDFDKLKIGKYVNDNYGSLKYFFHKKGFARLMKYVEIVCNSCGEHETLDNWYIDKNRPWGLYYTCPKCRKDIMVNYYKNNPEKVFELNHRRREMSEVLPYINLDKNNWIKKRNEFGWKCAFSKRVTDISMDHFIPVAIGHGGTYYENLIPLNRSINSSKNDANPFLWSRNNKEYINSVNRVVEYLAIQNNLLVKEYKNFVNWCFDNKRTIDEARADPRHSIEIWRESTGIQFPLPSYVYKPRVNDNLNEIGNRSNIGSDYGNGHEINENNAEGGTAS